jgi:hypothetical protein
MFTVRQIREKFLVTEATVLAWIASGELRALNCGTSVKNKKPRYRIRAADLEAFEAARLTAPAPSRFPRSRQPDDVLDFVKK